MPGEEETGRGGGRVPFLTPGWWIPFAFGLVIRVRLLGLVLSIVLGATGTNITSSSTVSGVLPAMIQRA